MEGDEVWIAFGVAALTVDETAVSTIHATTGVITVDGDEGWHIEDGDSKDFDLRLLPKEATHFALKSTGTSGYVRLSRTSGGIA